MLRFIGPTLPNAKCQSLKMNPYVCHSQMKILETTDHGMQTWYTKRTNIHTLNTNEWTKSGNNKMSI